MGEKTAPRPEDCPASANPTTYVDRCYDDFDAQSEQLTAHDQEYYQLSSGAFRGRFISAFLGEGISLHLEAANRALEQRVGCPENLISLGLVIGGDKPFDANGLTLTGDDVLFTKPGREMILRSPAGGQILAICMGRHTLQRSFHDEHISDLLDPDRGGISVIKAPSLSRQLRSNALGVLWAVCSPNDGACREDVAGPLVATVAAQIALHDAVVRGGTAVDRTESRRTCLEARKLMLADDMDELDYDRLCRALKRSRRSIQLAFARHANTTPSRYLRDLRLTRARRALSTVGGRHASIGDIAADHGFWSWSQFSQLYKAHFNELPSRTRSRAHAAAM